MASTSSARVQHAEVGRDFEVSAQVLGTGYSGAVRLATSVTTRQQVAVKTFSKRRLKPHRLQLLQSEVEVYLRLDHPNICRLLRAYEGKHDVWLIMELCGCELYSRLCERKAYRERDAAAVMLQMLQAVTYLHSHHIVHRDLKLENWMYGATERDDRVKLIDFGFSRIVNGDNETLDMPCGTLHYTSPEVLGRKYTNKCDIWSLGVICYMLLVGKPPFRGPNNLRIAKSIIQEDFPRDGRWVSLSLDAQSFVEHLLQKDPYNRPDAAMALRHRWMTDGPNQASLSSTEIGVDVLRGLRTFAKGSHLRRVALTMMAYSLTSRELQDLEETFLAFDKSGRGTITLEQLAKVMKEHLDIETEEVKRIFESLDFANDEEVHYTPFIAAMLATRVSLNEDKVRMAFEAFDRDRSGFITADSLVRIFNLAANSGKHLQAGPKVTENGHGALTKEEAERWIREVDYKGNGVIDYEGFLAALQGKKLWALPDLGKQDDQPTVRVFAEGRPRGASDSFVEQPGSSSMRIRHNLAQAIIDSEIGQEQKAQSWAAAAMPEPSVKVRSVSCDLDERYFAPRDEVPALGS